MSNIFGSSGVEEDDIPQSSPFIGMWIDHDKQFFDGATIKISARGWRPLGPAGPDGKRLPFRSGASYMTTMLKPDRLELCESFTDGSEQHFDVTPDADGTLRVHPVGSELYWVLKRQRG